MPVDSFHPVIESWFASRFAGPTEPQERGWPHIAAGAHTLIAAPTGSGKTLTAFLAVIDRLFREATGGTLSEGMRVVYVSPLRALSNDMHRNLEEPLAEIYAQARDAGLDVPPIRVGLRTGDTPSHRRAALVRHPPHLLVTTPESLYLLLTAAKGRAALRTVDTVIVDEIHALVRDKRGSHLALTLERLEHLCGRRLQRIGLSATQKPIERMAEFLIGARDDGEGPGAAQPSLALGRPPADLDCACRIVDVGHARALDLAIETPPSELSAVCSYEQWAEINARIVELVNAHRSTLIFVNTRRLAERLTHQLTQLLGEDAVASHHGSLSADIRLTTERRLKQGQLKAVVATASLELGIDVGYIDLVIQIGSPRSIATFLQRIGRSGHALGLTPKGRLFALTRDELLECMALMRAVRQRRLDVIPIPEAPLDILAQQIVAEVAGQEWSSDELFALCRRAAPYRHLARERFDRIVHMLSEGITDNAGRSHVYLHHDQVHRRLRARPAARLIAINNGGAIPEIDSFRVVAEPDMTVVGSVDEDFAIESMAGDIFLLGNTSWRIHGVRGNDLIVSDAQGAPPTIPFWRGEAPGRTWELSQEVSRLREELQARSEESGVGHHASAVRDEGLVQWLMEETCSAREAAQQVVTYVAAQQAAIGLVPTQARVVFERFFDDSGGMQLVVHAPFGGRITRAWGLAMRKRFCRSFDFELQATADDDGFILSLGPQHSFPIESLFPMLRSDNVRNLLEQALLAVPVFQLRWRWNVTRALQVQRQKNGKKVPPQLQRFRAQDLLTAVFPKLTGCQENITGDHEIPDHPLVQQTMHDCLHEALDFDGLERVLAAVERGEITFVARDTREPSPFAYELLNANPYAFLDGGEIQERRARTAQTRRSLTVESVRDLGRLDPEAIAQVTAEAQPLVRNADELHDALLSRIVLPADEGAEWTAEFDRLAGMQRAARVRLPAGLTAWVAAERLPAVRAAFGDVATEPRLDVPAGVRNDWTAITARVDIVRGLTEVSGPIVAESVARRTGITAAQAAAALEALEGEGAVLRGRFTNQTFLEGLDGAPAADAGGASVEWCHRRLLARIHRLTLAGLRREIEPVDVATYVRFLARHQGLIPGHRRQGAAGVFDVVGQLQGLDLPAAAWERDVLPARVEGYRTAWLDELCLNGEVGWGRLYPPPRDPGKSRPLASLTRVAPVSLFLREDLEWLTESAAPADEDGLSSPAREVLELLRRQGALFAGDILNQAQLLPAQLDELLGELVTRGFLTADGFSGLRTLIRESGGDESAAHAPRGAPKMVRRRRATGQAGRWSLWRRDPCAAQPPAQAPGDAGKMPSPEHMRIAAATQWAWQLLRRWGVVFRDLLDRESGAPRWFELLQVYRRLEARGEIRGGRFIRGVAGEQFTLGDTVRALRQLRDEAGTEELLIVCGADPLNLSGIVGDSPRIPSTAAHRVAVRGGVPVAALVAGEVQFLRSCSAAEQATSRLRLLGLDHLASCTMAALPAETETPEIRAVRRSGPSRPQHRPVR